MAQITSVVSEPLRAKIRSLLPSQSGFTEDLQAQNVIVPIIDLTETASGSVLREDLQRALAFGSQTEFIVSNSTTTVANIAGFWRLTAGAFIRTVQSGTVPKVRLLLSDGATDKIAWASNSVVTTVAGIQVNNLDYTFFLRAGDELKIRVDSGDASCLGSVRQIADSAGNLINPSGFTSE